MRVKIIRKQVSVGDYRKGDVLMETEIATITVSQADYRKLKKDYHNLNNIFAGGGMNPRYQLVIQ